MFITFEGVDGSGKTSLTNLLGQWLNEKNIPHVLTKEPGNSISKECGQIRKIILDSNNNICNRTEMFLYLADRSEHVEKVIKPALRQQYWVVSDRYTDSTKVYQGIARGLGSGIDDMIEYASSGITPDITFVLDVDPEISLKRAKTSNKEFKDGDRLELESIFFYNKIRQGFLDLASKHLRYVVIDATETIDNMFLNIKETLKPFVNKNEYL